MVFYVWKIKGKGCFKKIFQTFHATHTTIPLLQKYPNEACIKGGDTLIWKALKQQTTGFSMKGTNEHLHHGVFIQSIEVS